MQNQCIKIVVNGDETETLREQRYYRQLNKKEPSPWTFIPPFISNVSTNRGEGAVFTLIRDDDGTPSNTLQYFLESGNTHQLPLLELLLEFRQKLLDFGILTMHLKPANIVWQRQLNSIGQLYLVDSLGAAEFVPVCRFSKRMTRLKIQRRWNRFESLLWKQIQGSISLNGQGRRPSASLLSHRQQPCPPGQQEPLP